MLRFCSVLAFAVLATVSLSASAQWTSSKITFRNAGTRSQGDLEAAAGIHGHEKISRASIQSAAQRLMNSGYFDDVKVDTEGEPNAMEVIFILDPASAVKETPVGFDNFVWFTPEELQAAVRKAAPLFDGKLPDAGNQADAIQAGLQAALVAKGVTGTVINETLQPTSARPYTVTDFQVSPSPRIAAAHLSGTPPELAAKEDEAISRLTGAAYNEGASGNTTAASLLMPALNAGYLEAQLHDLKRTVDATGGVNVSATLDAGSAYRVAALNFPADAPRTIPAKDALHAGDIASQARLLRTLTPLEVAYRKQGYMDVYVETGEALDKTSHTASYNLKVVPGEIYHLHSLSREGLAPLAQQEFDRSWRLAPGDVYDADYVSHFIENNSALRSLGMYKATFRAEADPNTHLVDLTIKFSLSSPQAK